MKTKIFLTVAAASAIASVNAQDYRDALRFNQNDVEGTARSLAMGGAFGALGADLTSMVINPAGMAVYRVTEMGLTFGVNGIGSESNYWGTNTQENRVKATFNQIGVGCGFANDASSGFAGSNFYVGYNRLADYNSLQVYRDRFSRNSLLDYFCSDEQKTMKTTGDLAYNAYLTNDLQGGVTTNVWENVLDDGKFDDTFRYDASDGLGLVNIHRRVKTTGYKGEFTIGYAANISNKVYIGGSVGIIPLEYKEAESHNELFEGYTVDPQSPNEFTYRRYLDQDGTGANFKLGVIIRPINELRIGFALHSPTFFTIKEEYWAEIYSNSTKYQSKTDIMDYEYNYHSPSRFVASVAGVINGFGLISFDYERTNNSRSKFKTTDDLETEEVFEPTNDAIRNDLLKASNTLRFGLEVSALQPLYIRMGGRVTTSPINEDYYDTKPQHFAISGGIGYRNQNFFADISYVGGVTKSDAWVLPDTADKGAYLYDTNAPAELTLRQHAAVLTLGLRF